MNDIVLPNLTHFVEEDLVINAAGEFKGVVAKDPVGGHWIAFNAKGQTSCARSSKELAVAALLSR